jgi:hypothetical protein
MEECSGIQGEDQAVTMSQLLNSGEHRAAHLQGLVRIGQPPRFPGGIDPTIHPQVQAIVNGQGVVVPRVAQRHSMRQVAAGGRTPQSKRRLFQRAVSQQEEPGVVEALGEAEELLPQLARSLQLRPRYIPMPQPPQH